MPAAQMGGGSDNKSSLPQGLHSLLVKRQEWEDLRAICASQKGLAQAREK